MKIGIVSDTHGNVANFKKAVVWMEKEKIQVILHCGDIGLPETLRESLAGYKGEFFGVFGNMDTDYKILVDEYKKIPRVKIEEEILETEIVENPPSPEAPARRKKIAVTHRPEAARKLAESRKYDMVFYGHTHKPCKEEVRSTSDVDQTCRLINPGELAGQFYKPTFAVYDTESGLLELKILEKL